MRKLLVVCIVLLSGGIFAQDIHFAQQNLSPMLLNPALSGLNACDYRLYANARIQWPTISGWNVYRTVAAGGDMTLGKATKINSFAGIGFSFFNDQAGDLGWMHNRLDVSLAYHFMLNRKGTMSLSAAIQGSFNHRGIDPSQATFDTDYDNIAGTIINGPKESIGRPNLFFGDVGLGFLWNYNTRSEHNFFAGLAFSHLNQPQISFLPNGQDESIAGDERLFFKTTIHGGALLRLSNQFALQPQFMFFIQGPSREYTLGLNTRIKLSQLPYQKTYLYLGASYRVLDAIILNTRIDVKGFTIAASYDINLSKLTAASRTIGAPEIHLMYQGCFKRKINKTICPAL